MNERLVAGMADAHPHAAIVVAALGRDGAQAIVAGIAASGLHPELGRRQVEFVMEHYGPCRGDLEEAHGLPDRAPALVHVGPGHQQQTFSLPMVPSAQRPWKRCRQGEKR